MIVPTCLSQNNLRHCSHLSRFASYLPSQDKVAEGFVKMCKDMDSKFKVIVALRSAHMHIEIERNFVCSEICMIEIIILSDWTKRKKKPGISFLCIV